MHFLKETDFSREQARAVLREALTLKRTRGSHARPLEGQTWAMMFSKSSTRTRVSFDVGIHELGGHSVYLSRNDIQLGRGETVADTARVLSRYVHGMIVRTFGHNEVEELAAAGTVPVVNALTDFLHPCQVYSDALTMAERWANGGDLLDSLRGRKIAFLGDTASNMANSWILGAAHFGMSISLAGPVGYEPGAAVRALVRQAGYSEDFHFTHDAAEAVAGADVVYTDVWVSMGKEIEESERLARMRPYSATAQLFGAAKPDALFMHCLPAYAGKEVTQEVLDSPRSVIFDQAENRLHAQKAILAFCRAKS
ncbi:MAG TPA: ornithine carbamoyltransferase [Opitutaceae bacterium]